MLLLLSLRQRRRMRREQAAVSAAAGSSSSGGSMGVTRPWYCTLQQWTTDFGAKGGLATTIRYYHHLNNVSMLISTSYIK
jgi:hypothetical protein